MKPATKFLAALSAALLLSLPGCASLDQVQREIRKDRATRA